MSVASLAMLVQCGSGCWCGLDVMWCIGSVTGEHHRSARARAIEDSVRERGGVVQCAVRNGPADVHHLGLGA